MRLGLGTVQFGMDYGISNTTGQTTIAEVGAILDLAWSGGVRDLDTASLYDEAESVLGHFVGTLATPRIVTKTPQLDKASSAQEARDIMREGLALSCRRLGVNAVYGLLAHRAQDLLGPFGPMLIEEMKKFKQQGLITRYGASVYNAAEIEGLLETYDQDAFGEQGLVQVPLNVFDQRLVTGGQIAQLRERGIEVHARSLFLQGVLLMSPDDVPDFFAPLQQHFLNYHAVVNDLGVTPLAAALAFARDAANVDVGIVGVNTAAHLRDILEAWETDVPLDFSPFAVHDEAFLNPSLWRLN